MMNLWKIQKANHMASFDKTGLHLRVEQGVNPEVRRSCLSFSKWLREQYVFPVRVIIYIKKSYYISAQNGENVYGTCWRPFDKSKSPYIRISTGDYDELVVSKGQDNALATILFCIAMMLTHYYQWLNDINGLTEEEEELQAEKYAKKILSLYSQTRDHP